MRVDDFDYELPRELIAQSPARPRDSARLLVIGSELEDRTIRDLPRLLRRGDLLVVNDTKVVPTRLLGTRGAAKVEMTLHRDLGSGRWLAFARPARRLAVGDKVTFSDSLAATIVARGDGGEVTVAFALSGDALQSALARDGAMPLPPYIRRPEGADPADRADYQTMFAAAPGAVAAPTAGLHFTPRLLRALDEAGVDRVAGTLHVGAGTFLPVKVDDTRDHEMHAETAHLSAEVAERVNAARAAGGRIVAVGSTALRLLESASADDGRVAPFDGETRLFVTPGYRFKVVDLLLTNFHLPRSTLLMMVAAFAGLERTLSAYAHAVREGYRFFSYGDACLIHPMAA